MTNVRIGPRRLVEALGGHPIADLGLDFEVASDLGRWLLIASLLSGRIEPARAQRASAHLRECGLLATDRLAKTDPAEVLKPLALAQYPAPAQAAARLVRIARGVEECGGSLGALARESAGIFELGERLTRLAPGLGAATVALFLRPLRDVWPAAGEIPLHPAARAAAVHLGLIAAGEDEDGEPGALRAALRGSADAPSFADVEWALERLGRKSCVRGRAEKCPLKDLCPLAIGAGIGVATD